MAPSGSCRLDRIAGGVYSLSYRRYSALVVERVVSAPRSQVVVALAIRVALVSFNRRLACPNSIDVKSYQPSNVVSLRMVPG
jgi:hypothetical protein